MLGIMGCSAAFAQAACAKKQEGNFITFIAKEDDPIGELSCVGDIVIETIKNGEKQSASYSNLANVEVSFNADVDTEVKIIGEQITKLKLSHYDGSDHGIASDLVISGCKTLKYIGIGDCDISSISFDFPELEYINCNKSNIQKLDLTKSPLLTHVDALKCPDLEELRILDSVEDLFLGNVDEQFPRSIKTILCGANVQDVCQVVADAIRYADSTTGTVYTDSEGTYYSTIATAATTKGWTIAQIPA